MSGNQSEPSHDQKRAVISALKFVYPNIKISSHARITPELAGLSFFLARALDSTSRITYGFFKFYEGILTGVLKGGLTWKDIPGEVANAVKSAVEDEKPQRNLLVSTVIRGKIRKELLENHMRDPENFPCPSLKINKDLLLDRIIYKL